MSLALFKQALEGTDEIEVTVTGRSSGRRITNPVWFVQEGGDLYLLPSEDRTPTGTETC